MRWRLLKKRSICENHHSMAMGEIADVRYVPLLAKISIDGDFHAVREAAYALQKIRRRFRGELTKTLGRRMENKLRKQDLKIEEVKKLSKGKPRAYIFTLVDSNVALPKKKIDYKPPISIKK